MIVLVDADDGRAIRNKDNILALYDLMINRKNPEEAVATLLVSDYVQHNPLVPDGSTGLAEYFGKVTKDRPRLKVVVHRIIVTGGPHLQPIRDLLLISLDLSDFQVRN